MRSVSRRHTRLPENERLVLRRRHHIESNVLALERLRYRRAVKFFQSAEYAYSVHSFRHNIMKQYCGCFV